MVTVVCCNNTYRDLRTMGSDGGAMIVMLVAGLLRAGLIVYGEWQDTQMEVPYTDIDYTVFSDAARLMVEGKSPFERHTYRYSPLLALVLVPNILLHRCWGKLLFAAAGSNFLLRFPCFFLFLFLVDVLLPRSLECRQQCVQRAVD